MRLHKLAAGAVLAAALLIGAAAAAHPPYGLVADPAGNVYFSDLETVWRLAPDGALAVFRPGAEGGHVHELALAPDGGIEGDLNRYDSSTGTYYGAIWRRSPDGRERWVMAPTSAPPKGTGLWRDREGNRYLAQWPNNDDRRTMLFRRSPDGGVAVLYGPRDEAGRFRQLVASSVGGMSFPADGTIVFADQRVLRRVAPSGVVTTLYQGPDDASLRGIAIAPDGRILVADHGRAQVLAVASSGKAEMLYSSGSGWSPTGVAVSHGRLLVLEANTHPYDYVNRVRVLEVKGGKARVVARPAEGPTGPASATEPGSGGMSGGAAWAAGAAALIGTIALLLRRRRAG